MSAKRLYLAVETPRTPEGYRFLVSSKDFDLEHLNLLAQAERMVPTRTRAGTQREGREVIKLYTNRCLKDKLTQSEELNKTLQGILTGEVNQHISGLSDADWRERLLDHLPSASTFLFTPELSGCLEEIKATLSNQTDTLPQENPASAEIPTKSPHFDKENPSPKKRVWVSAIIIILLLVPLGVKLLFKDPAGDNITTILPSTTPIPDPKSKPQPPPPKQDAVEEDIPAAVTAPPIAPELDPTENTIRSPEEIIKDIIRVIEEMEAAHASEDLEKMKKYLSNDYFEPFYGVSKDLTEKKNTEYKDSLGVLKKLTEELKESTTSESP